ncbi:hypothetical protein A2482_04445 [Candidatus Falkowbacteria bacterium RIFOXYC2_FULL_48_21]|uniref:Uncharacterized protein n=1 Tax=Candidatus Falkowbacteria bacterium RIFOXYC2_FULL_48_21 TaxID=1798005 RepID=A0A1F5TED1_9BACT|nr:MAG: hypothetical protein A2482_04445 [Candidatus Falkowbacteria bacterium RIFOXYC2_FULL_48_21]
MKESVVFFALTVLTLGCLNTPEMWKPPDGLSEVDGADLSAETEATDDSRLDEKTDESKDAVDAVEDQGVDVADTDVDGELGADSVDQLADEGTDDHADEQPDKPDVIDAADEGALDVDDVDQTDAPDVPGCPPGYKWDAETEKCISFCPADQYYEPAIGKCLYYPLYDLTGEWKLSVLDSDTMNFTVYDLQLDQTVSYLLGILELSVPLEMAECSGTMQTKKLVLTCDNELYSLLLSSGTVEEDGSFSGFYTYNYKDGAVKSGPFNIDEQP